MRTLYGVLMLLPQSDAFAMLRCRLNCVPPNHHLMGYVPPNHHLMGYCALVQGGVYLELLHIELVCLLGPCGPFVMDLLVVIKLILFNVLRLAVGWMVQYLGIPKYREQVGC